MTFERLLDTYFRARFTLIILVTSEERRAIEAIRAACKNRKPAPIPCLQWDAADFFKNVAEWKGQIPPAQDPKTALEFIQKHDGEAIFVLKDFHDLWKQSPIIKRKLRNLAQELNYSKKTIIVTCPSEQIPEELKDEAVTVFFGLPDQNTLQMVLDRICNTAGVKVNLSPHGRDKILQAALGLTEYQAQRVFAKAVVNDGVLDDNDIPMVTEEKRNIIKESKALEFFPAIEESDDIGGLGALKEWLRLRDRAFSEEARKYGLPSPKGIALIGIPGTGKSLAAKVIGKMWQQPLLRLDIGALFGSLVGESEERTRKALSLAETVAPCIVWIDEMEKAFAHGGSDGGTSTRVFASILTWMQEKTKPCFVVATANDVTAMPPELLRKGRFDDIFFLNLPTTDERQEIFSVHLRKRGRGIQDYDLKSLASASEGYVGAELEQAIIDAMYLGFNDGGREFSTTDIVSCLKRQVPLSVSQKEKIEYLREWLKQGRAQSASFTEKREAEKQMVPLFEVATS